jgi:hypothetical protein
VNNSNDEQTAIGGKRMAELRDKMPDRKFPLQKPSVDELSPDHLEWLRKRAETLRQRWRASEEVMAASGKQIGLELEKLREIDWQLPFMVLYIWLERELARPDVED